MQNENRSHLEALWSRGQDALAAGRYLPARRDLSAAADLACRHRDPTSLARIYLPLLEACRQIRQLATDGLICIASATALRRRRTLARFLSQPAGTLLILVPRVPRRAIPAARAAALALARAVEYAARRQQTTLESLLLLPEAYSAPPLSLNPQRAAVAPQASALTPRNSEFSIPHSAFRIEPRLASPTDPTLAASLPTHTTANPSENVSPDISLNLVIPLPPPADYPPAHPLHPLARESLLIAWEALALQWQGRHPTRFPPTPDPWQEIAALRRALLIDPACEPIAMRLITVAESLARSPSHAP